MNLESYPPLFSELSKSSNQQEYLSSDQHHQKVDTIDSIIIKPEVQDSDPIPVIDLQSLSLDELGEACKDWGLFRLVNHGVPPSLLSQLQDHAKTLYSLSFQSKQALFTTPTSYFWGTPALTPSGAPLSRGPQKINWVEGFNIPISQLSQLQPQHPVLASFRYTLHFIVYFFFFLLNFWLDHGWWSILKLSYLFCDNFCMEESNWLDFPYIFVKESLFLFFFIKKMCFDKKFVYVSELNC